jgi:hypothetical protein
LHRIEKFLLFPDENFAKWYGKLTKIYLSNSSAFHTILQNFRQEKLEIFLFYAKAGFFVSFVKIVCTTLKSWRSAATGARRSASGSAYG